MNCKCGCGEKVSPGKMFRVGHNSKIKKDSFVRDEKRDAERVKKISQANKGRKLSESAKAIISRENCSRIKTKEERQAISQRMIEYWKDGDKRAEHSLSLKTWWKVPGNKEAWKSARKEFLAVKESYEKRKGRRKQIAVDDCDDDFAKNESWILERDGFCCQICEDPFDLVAHYIDWDKKNSIFDNLVTLCRHCHGIIHNDKSNFYWWYRFLTEYRLSQPAHLVCGVDSGSFQTGIAFVDEHDNIRNMAILKSSEKGPDDRIFEIADRFRMYLTLLHPVKAVFEESIYIQNPRTTILLASVIAILKRICYEMYIPYQVVPNKTWKKVLLKNGNAGKDEILKKAQERWGYVDFDYQDLADSAFIASWGQHEESKLMPIYSYIT